MDNLKTINRIKSRRKEIRLTQSQLAQKVGRSLMTIVRWEKGERSPDIAIMPKLAEALNTSVAYLMGIEDHEDTTDQRQALSSLTTKLSNEDNDFNAPITAGMDQDKITITDWNNNRTFSFPNNDEGRKALALVLSGSLQGMGLTPVISNTISGGNNKDVQQGIINN